MNKTLIGLVVLTAVLVGGWYVYSAKGGPATPFDAWTHGIMSLIALYAYGRVRETYKKSGNVTHKYLSNFLLSWVVTGLSVAIGNFYFYDVPQLFGLSFIVALIAVFPGVAYLVRVPFVLKNAPALEQLVFRLILLVGALIILFNIIYWPMSYVNEQGFTVYNSGFAIPFFGLIAFTAYGAVSALMAIFFLYGALAGKDAVSRMRSLFFTIGMVLSVGLGLHLAGAGALSSWGEFGVAAGFLFILLGVLYKD